MHGGGVEFSETPAHAVEVAAARRMAEGALQGEKDELSQKSLSLRPALQLAEDLILSGWIERREASQMLLKGRQTV